MFTGMIIASVNYFNQGSPDKNGKNPVILNVVAGKCPNRTVLSGTVAENMDIKVGKTYLFTIREGQPSEEYGRQFVFGKLKELDALEIIDAATKIGSAQIFDVSEEVTIKAEEVKVAFADRE